MRDGCRPDSIAELMGLRDRYTTEHPPRGDCGFAGVIQELSSDYDPFLVVLACDGKADLFHNLTAQFNYIYSDIPDTPTAWLVG